jgi:acyl-coenzyme A thioesterase PaaI-like protein
MRAGAGAFIQRFWGYAPRKTAKGATCTTWNGPHVGNRVGHAQGGFTFGLATTTASAALPAAWHLASANAWYIGPGLGKKLIAKSTIVHRGLSTAVVHTRLEDEDQRGVLECMTSHTHGRRD